MVPNVAMARRPRRLQHWTGKLTLEDSEKKKAKSGSLVIRSALIGVPFFVKAHTVTNLHAALDQGCLDDQVEPQTNLLIHFLT